jgi:excisionase family DNA binding protein
MAAGGWRARGYITVADALRIAPVAVATMYRWLNEGKVRGVRVGGSRYIHKASLVAYLGTDTMEALAAPVPEGTDEGSR